MKQILILMTILLIIVSCVKQEQQPEIIVEAEVVEDEQPEQEVPVEEETPVEEPIVPKEPVVEEIPPTEPVPEETSDITLTAEVIDNQVQLTWTPFKGDFKAYKVERSVTKTEPKYPSDELVETIADVSETSVIDKDPYGGFSYYGVTVLGPFNEKYYSNFVTVELPSFKETPDQEIQIVAELTEDGVLLTWDEYLGDFLFYKVAWTQDHPYPKYPDDKTLTTIAYANQTSYLDTRYKTGMNYYAVTVIRPDKTRFTSLRTIIDIKEE